MPAKSSAMEAIDDWDPRNRASVRIFRKNWEWGISANVCGDICQLLDIRMVGNGDPVLALDQRCERNPYVDGDILN